MVRQSAARTSLAGRAPRGGRPERSSCRPASVSAVAPEGRRAAAGDTAAGFQAFELRFDEHAGNPAAGDDLHAAGAVFVVPEPLLERRQHLAALAFFGGPFGRVIARPAHGARRAAGRPAPGCAGPGAAGLCGQPWQVSHRVSASGKP